MSLTEEEKKRIDREIAAQRYREQQEAKVFKGRRLLAFLGSAVGLFLLTLIFQDFIPFVYSQYQEKQKETPALQDQQGAGSTPRADERENRQAEIDAQLAEMEKDAQRAAELRREIENRLLAFQNLPDNRFAPQQAREIERATTGAKQTGRFENEPLSVLLRELSEKTTIAKEKKFCIELEELVVGARNLLSTISVYQYPITNSNKVLAKGTDIQKREGKYDARELKQYYEHWVELRSGEKVLVPEGEHIIKEAIVLSESQRNALRAIVKLVEDYVF